MRPTPPRRFRLPIQSLGARVLVLALLVGSLGVLGAPTADAQGVAGEVQLAPGFTNVTYTGATLPVEEALNNAASVVPRLFRFNAATQDWDLWAVGVPAAVLDFETLENGRAYLVYAEEAIVWTFIPADESGAPAPTLGVSVLPASGASGTVARITIVDARPAEVLTILVGGTELTAVASDAGVASVTESLVGPAGTILVIHVISGVSGSARTGQTTFLVTEAPGAATDRLSLSLSPSSGPSGTEAVLAISDAPPSAGLLIIVGDTTQAAFANTSGTAIVRVTVSGTAGISVPIAALTSVSGVNRGGTAAFRITSAAGDASGDPLGVTLESTSGPSDTNVAIVVTGADPSAEVTLVIGSTVSFATADTNGTVVTSHTFSGSVGATVVVNAISGEQRTGSATFAITSGPAAASTTLTVRPAPTSGPTGTRSEITVSNASPGATVTLTAGNNVFVGTADGAGVLRVTLPMSGSTGSTVGISASATLAGTTRTGSGSFAVTATSLAVLIAPGSGASGTAAQVLVTGATAGQPVTIRLGTGQTFTATADAAGQASIVTAFSGSAGQVIRVAVWAGTAGSLEAATGIFTITA